VLGTVLGCDDEGADDGADVGIVVPSIVALIESAPNP
jgi:hypothetical protein